MILRHAGLRTVYDTTGTVQDGYYGDKWWQMLCLWPLEATGVLGDCHSILVDSVDLKWGKEKIYCQKD